ncbi:zinc metalloprotease [Bacteroidia bacterium]|nr:zinc metalloprotease [Bacteroidia bacterium]
MEIVIKIVQFILSFSLLVLIHEFGHFIAARAFGIRVEKFYLFFNPWFSLVKIKGRRTEFGIGWVPFGGYCKIAGMIDESMDTEQLKQPPQSDEYRSKPAWQRLLVISGGVIMNIILALIIYTGISYVWGDDFFAGKDIRYGYAFSQAGREIGFENGDKIVGINGRSVERYNNVYMDMVLKRRPKVEIERTGELVTLALSDDDAAAILTSGEPLLRPRTPFVVEDVLAGGGAAGAGIVPGDSLVALDGTPLGFADQYLDAFKAHSGQTVEVTLVRDSAGTALRQTLPVAVSDKGTIGISYYLFDRYIPLTTLRYNFWQSIPAGFNRTGLEVSNYWKQFELLFRPKVKAYKSLGGPIAIGNIFPSYWSLEAFWRITAFLSIVLAVMNILPIPGLDGGHILFLLVEVITGRKPSDKFLETVQWIGLILIFTLISFATGNDIYRLFLKG